MKNIDKAKIYSATWDANERKVVLHFDKLPEAKSFFDWLNEESE